MCKVISVSNQKGGVGKTVTCVNLGIGLAREGYKVLMIDADPQGSLSISLGFDEPDKLENCGWKRGKYDHFRATVSEGIGEVEVPEAEYVACGICDGVLEKEHDQGL